ncbi:ImmA/IrrE family metallo-endopeptidase [Variovorax dokdonensis]|uniref:ImmA/IrrE family metallo-endopeptidase n=1 Tax=Variovorax dokdonensis TaxID=344883 RepID=A0ABT7N746_9BURK|nr:ImmA/IrrE family metallo-endopeptidase [Variovorax dokdonensis]MDM0043771.1 ImmA/IrrE family metallo-endopeptidase [Variovorax dokdonensis]
MMQELEGFFRPEMVGLRRRMLGMSQADLVLATGISQGMISKIEQGVKAPSGEHLEKLATAMDCRLSFFFQAEREYGPPMSAHPMYRKKASVGQKVLDKVIAELSVRLGHVRVLLNAVEFTPELPLPQYDADEYAGQIEEVAAMVRRAWYVPRGPIRSLIEFVERAGILVVLSDMEAAHIDGASYQVAGMPPVIFLNRSLPSDRLRFSLAHELGHIVLHRFPSPEMEQQANEFAAAFLMPREDIAGELKGMTLTKAAQLKPYWKVSMGALIVRAKILGRVDEGSYSWLWRQMAMQGYRTREPASLDFAPEQPSLAPALLANLTENMGYEREDVEQALHLSFDEISRLYGIKPPISGLRRVK